MLPEVRALLDQMEALDTPKLTDLPLPEMREAFALSAKALDEDGPAVAHISDHMVETPDGAVPVRLYDPAPGDTPTPVMVYYHGGGFMVGDRDTHDGVTRRLAAGLGFPVLAVSLGG